MGDPVGVAVDEEGGGPGGGQEDDGQPGHQLDPRHRQQAEQPEPQQQVDLPGGHQRSEGLLYFTTVPSH